MKNEASLVKEKEFLADTLGNLGSRPTAAAIKLGHHQQTMSPVTDSPSSWKQELLSLGASE